MKNTHRFYTRLTIVMMALIFLVGMDGELLDPTATPFIVIASLMLIGIGFSVENHMNKAHDSK